MELLLVEEQVKNLIHTKAKLSSNEKVRRITMTLDFITNIYLKHQEELPVDEAYDILFFEDTENEKV